MKRSDFLIRFTFALAFLAIVMYIGYAIYDSQVNPLSTVYAVTGSQMEAAEVSGYIVRNETVIAGGVTDAVVIAENGSRTAVNARLGIRCLTDDSAERRLEIEGTEQRIRQIETLLSHSSGGTAELARSSVGELAYAVRNGDYASIGAACSDIGAYVITDGETLDAAALEDELALLRARLSRLVNAIDADTVTITAPVSGLFSTALDGYESVTPEMLAAAAPSELASLFSESNRDKGAGMGKLITGSRWYFGAVMDSALASRLGRTAELTFLGDYNGTLLMRVESRGDSVDGKCTVIFSCGKAMREISGARRMDAQVDFGTVSGILVPREAMHLDADGTTYIYVISGLQAQRVDVEILGEKDSLYIVDYEQGGFLSEGTEIITRANGIFDGKVVR